MKEKTQTERTIMFNALRKQILEYQEREHELCKFLRQLNRDQDSISDKHTNAFIKVCDIFIPNG